MITKIISCADLHFPSLRKIDELKEVLSNFIEQCKDIVEKEGRDNVRIVVAGDIFENKITITNESITAVDWFFKQLNEICKTIVVAGNHDLLVNNMDRLDSLSPLFEIGQYENVVYLDKELDYKSGTYVDDNIVWCLYSTFDNFASPNIDEMRETNKGKVFVGVIHADVNGATTALNRVTEHGIDISFFDGVDFVIAGHIHKYQEIKGNNVSLVYCSSIRQKEFGETVTGHGFVLWDVKKKKHEFVEVDNSNGGFYKFSINGIEDLENDKEELLNY